MVGRQLDACVYTSGGDTKAAGGVEVPLWVWLMWIPQLLIGLQRAELPHVKKILTALAIHHPQVSGQGRCRAAAGLRGAGMAAGGISVCCAGCECRLRCRAA